MHVQENYRTSYLFLAIANFHRLLANVLTTYWLKFARCHYSHMKIYLINGRCPFWERAQIRRMYPKWWHESGSIAHCASSDVSEIRNIFSSIWIGISRLIVSSADGYAGVSFYFFNFLVYFLQHHATPGSKVVCRMNVFVTPCHYKLHKAPRFTQRKITYSVIL